MHPTMLEYAMVSVAKGVLNPLLGKLSSLVEKEYVQLKGVRKEIISMRDELRSMNALLEKLAAEDDPDVQVKEWRNQIRDLAYDVEDCVDDFLHRVEHGSSKQTEDVGFFHKKLAKLKALGARHDIAEKIRHLKVRVDDVSKRRDRYKFEGANSSSVPAASAVVVPVDTRLPALYSREGSLVGIDGPLEEITKMLLTQEEGEMGKRLKVVSIAGFGGLGKTTLAYEVYRRLGEQFDCKMDVSVSQSPDIIKILTKILSQAKGHSSHIDNVTEPQVLIDELRSYLLHKRYIIIIDDIWDEHLWDFVRCAFPDNNHGSRVITTTRVETVAKVSCTYRHECIYKMEPLNGEDSKKLFFGIIFGSEGACPSELEEVSSQILRKCGGLPLAIITIASLLASQAARVKEYWENVQNSMGSIVGTNRRLDVMRQILNLSYKDLLPHLKTCFLYLGAYREDTVVWRDDLVRQWVAEGFVGGMHGLAVNCFNELVNRSMIQPVTVGYNGEVLSCRVHDMMLDLIIRKYSAEENFLTVVERSQAIKIRGSTHNVRRLFHHSDEKRQQGDRRRMQAVDIDLSKLRSFSGCGSSTQGHIPPLSEFRFIRVLILDFLFAPEGEGREKVNLIAICRLFHLRYLKIRSEVELLLPPQIQALQHLQTLEIVRALPSIRRHISIALPSDVSQLPCLSYLSILPQMASLPDGIGTMRSLRSLASFVLEENSLESIREIRHLANLTELYVRVPVDQRFVESAEARVDVLCSSLPEQGGCKLYLTAWSQEVWFPSVPHWVSRLQKLYSLEIGVDKLCREGVAVLAGLPGLVRLDLWIRGVPREGTVIAGTGFLALKLLIVTCKTLRLTFEAGAMPTLQKLKLEFNVDGAVPEQGGCGNALTGIGRLSAVKDIIVHIGGFGAASTDDSGRRAAVVSAVRDAIGLLPNRVRVDIMCTQGRYG